MQHAEYVGAPQGALAIPLRARGGGVRAWTLVDEADYAWASQYNWSLTPSGYAARNKPVEGVRCKYTTQLMHREMLGLGNGRIDKRESDHINRDRLDNRRANLRIVTKQQNMQNQGVPKRRRQPTSKYRGVSFYKASGKWMAYCRIEGHLHHLGYYATEDEAGAVASAFRALTMPYSEDAA